MRCFHAFKIHLIHHFVVPLLPLEKAAVPIEGTGGIKPPCGEVKSEE